MFCSNCGNKMEDTAQFCGNCGTSTISHPQNNEIIKAKTVRSGVRIFLGLVIAVIVFGILGKVIMVIVGIIGSLLGVDSSEGLRDVESAGNILGLVGGAYIANQVYVSIAGKNRNSKSKKWYQFKGFM